MIPITSPQQLTSFEVVSFADSPKLRMVTAQVRTNIGSRQLVLWRGEAYEAAGQYTDADIIARVEALLSAP
jgi:hypothetical protein